MSKEKWRGANSETYKIILGSLGRTVDDGLANEDIEQIPSEAIEKLDALWMKYSDGHFCFSVQKEIWMRISGNQSNMKYAQWYKFADQVGWRINYSVNDWISTRGLIFDLSQAPAGHLPFWPVFFEEIQDSWGQHWSDAEYFLDLLKYELEPFDKEHILSTIQFETLVSDRGIDYTHLSDLLALNRWSQANNETRERLLELAGREVEEGFKETDYPNTDLQTIDQLWSKYQNRLFDREQIEDLSSERGVDYTRLAKLLAGKRWKEANQETFERMLEVVGLSIDDDLRPADIEKFPCKDLGTIDRLWVKYSDGKFGFSIQKQIFHKYQEQIGNTWLPERKEYDYFVDRQAFVFSRDPNQRAFEKFGEQVKWYRTFDGRGWDLNISFENYAPEGHLPAFVDLSYSRYSSRSELVSRWKSYALEVSQAIFSRLEKCGH